MTGRPAGEWLYDSLPELYRKRDAALGSPLRDLAGVLGEQGDMLWAEAEQLYDDQFIETCAPWLVPYVAALVGYRPLHEVGTVSQRALAGRWISLVRSKGTAATLEEVARGATDWPARVVEFFQRLSHPQYANHPRPEVHGAIDTRAVLRLEELGTAFDSAHHTIDVGRIGRGEGVFNIASIGLYHWRLRPGPFPRHRAFEVGARQFLYHPAGVDTPLFNAPVTEPDRRSIAQPVHLPIPLRRRRLDAELGQYHPRAFRIWIDGVEVNEAGLRVCNLSDDGAVWAHAPDDVVAIDPELGRIATPANDGPPGRVDVMFHDGFPGAVGGGSYERAADFATGLAPVTAVTEADNLQTAIGNAQTGGAVQIDDSETYEDAFQIVADADQRVELRAANGQRPTLRLTADMTVEGAAESEVTLNGLYILGGAVVVPDTGNNALRRLTLRDCTLLPGITANPDGTPTQPLAPSLIVEAPNVIVDIERSVVGGIRAHLSTVIGVENTAIDATERENVALSALDDLSPAGTVTLESVTVIGKIHARVFELISNSILDGALGQADAWPIAIQAENVQTGCARYSWIPPGSRVPRRYRCQPSLALGAALRQAEEENPALGNQQKAAIARRVTVPLRPAYTSLLRSRPAYLQLLTSVPREIRQGADDEGEMGVWHRLYQPQRESNWRFRMDEFLPSGLEAGLIYET